MYHLDNTSGVPEMPEPKDTQTISTRWFGESQEQGGISWPGADWFNIVQAELLAILKAAGKSPDKSKFNQIAESISELSDLLRQDIVKTDGFRFVGQCPSFDFLRSVPPMYAGQRILLSGWHEDSVEGGGEFEAVNEDSVDDGGMIARVNEEWHWKRIITDGKYTPEMWGARGDGTSDDYQALQNFLDSAPLGSTLWFAPRKSYFNAFNIGDGTRRDPNTLTRSKAGTLLFNGALITRRAARWNDSNNKDNSNSGPGYTDQDSAVLRITGQGPFFIDKPYINGGNPLGNIKNSAGVDGTHGGYAACECRDYGIHIVDATDVFISDAVLYRSCFNLYAKNSSNIRFTGKVFESGQAWKMISSDLALGAGIKLDGCTNVDVNVIGLKNTNATVEIEPNCNHVSVKGNSDNDFSNAVVVYDSSYVDLDFTATNVVQGDGLQLVHGAYGGALKFIRGRFITDSCSWIGAHIRMTKDALFDVEHIDLEVISTKCKQTGLWIDQASASATGKIMRDVNIKASSHDNANGIASGFAIRVSGDVRGEISGAVRNSYIGVLIDGINDPLLGLKLRLDLRDNVVKPYSISSTSYVDWFGTLTPSEIRLMSLAPSVTMSESTILGQEKNYNRIWLRATETCVPNLPLSLASATARYQLYAVQESNGSYTVKIKL